MGQTLPFRQVGPMSASIDSGHHNLAGWLRVTAAAISFPAA
jgi:hypothetical protein